VWPWFQDAAEAHTTRLMDVPPTEMPKPFSFRCSDVFSARERACVTVLLQVRPYLDPI
jgi:hypothetical protein